MHRRAPRQTGAAVLYSLLILALSCMAHAAPSQPSCSPVPTTTQTRFGGNMTIEIDISRPVRKLRGVVEWPGVQPASGVLLQVFTRNHSDPHFTPRDRETAPPIAACVTGADGAFFFSLPEGEYELRASLDQVTDVTSVFVTVKHGWRWSRRIVIPMSVGT